MASSITSESTNKGIECFYLFLDTNLLYSPKINYDVFQIKLMTDLLIIRDSFNKMYEGYRKIEILIPRLVVEEIYSIKAHLIQSEISKFEKTIQYLEEGKLKAMLEDVYNNAHHNLSSYGQFFLKSNDIEVVPYCNNDYFPTIVKKSINKQLPFKPYFDEKKERHVGDNGFKDTVIWYSIIDHVKKKCKQNNIHIFFLTNNEKDFKSDLTLVEFKEATGVDIEIIKFKSTNPKVNDSEFNPFLNMILEKSHVPIPVKLENVCISYLVINKSIRITSIIAEPLHINIISVINFQNKLSHFEEENKQVLNNKIKEVLSNFKFDISELDYHYRIPEIGLVTFTLYQSMFEVMVSEISITYNDGSEISLLPDLKIYESQETFYTPSEFEEKHDQIVSDSFIVVRTFLENKGFGSVSSDVITFEYFVDSELG
jgi:hypothetical protein